MNRGGRRVRKREREGEKGDRVNVGCAYAYETSTQKSVDR